MPARRVIYDFIDLMGLVVADPGTGCYIFVGNDSGRAADGKTGRGYGRVYYMGQVWAAHKLSYFLSGGRLRPGQQLDHLRRMGCRHRRCIRPEHLEPVSHKENCRRRDQHLMKDLFCDQPSNKTA